MDQSISNPLARPFLLESDDDVLQDVLVIVIRRIGSLDDPKLFRPWAFRIDSREAFRHIRKRRLWQGRHEDDYQLEQLSTPAVAPSGELLRRLLAAGPISPASRAVLCLHFEDELPLRGWRRFWTFRSAR